MYGPSFLLAGYLYVCTHAVADLLEADAFSAHPLRQRTDYDAFSAISHVCRAMLGHATVSFATPHSYLSIQSSIQRLYLPSEGTPDMDSLDTGPLPPLPACRDWVRVGIGLWVGIGL